MYSSIIGLGICVSDSTCVLCMFVDNDFHHYHVTKFTLKTEPLDCLKDFDVLIM